MSQSKLQLVKNIENEGVSLAVQRKGVNVGVLQHAPKQHINLPKIPKKVIFMFKFYILHLITIHCCVIA